MAKLTFDREVGLYAFNIDKYYDLEEDRKKNKKELELIASKLLELERLDKVLEYKKAREQFEILGYYKDEYFKSVNIYLRNALTEYKDPFVYIAQSNGFKNIISIDGRYVGNRAEGLSRGLYIINGKKVMIK